MALRPGRFLLFLVLILSVAAAVYSASYRSKYPRTSSVALPESAFLNAAWGMTPSQVEQANGSALERAPSSERFYQAPDSDRFRYGSYQRQGIRYLGREATITYTFRDDRLFAYHVFVSDTDGGALDADVRRYLTRVYGPDASPEEDEQSALKLIWHFRERIVNYWFMKDELSMSPRYTAVIGVTVQ